MKWAAPVQNYVRNLIDYSNSVVGNLHVFDRIEALLAKGDNVVMLANHQTEADPGNSPRWTDNSLAGKNSSATCG